MINSEFQPWIIRDFSGGLNQKVDDNLIANNQAADVQNCIVTIQGRLKKRPGCAKLNATTLGGAVQGLHAYHYGVTLASHKLVAAANGIVAYWDTGTSAFVNIATGLNTSAQVQFETCATYMVYMNGVNAPRKWNGAVDSLLSNAPATGKCPVLHKEKLFCISDINTVKWSENFKPETWLSVNYWEIDKGDGDELSGLWRFGRQLLVAKKLRLFKLKGTSFDDFEADCIEKQHGVAGLRAGIVLEPYFYYISKDGIFRWDGVQSFCISDPPDSSGLPGIKTLWDTVNKLYLSNAVAGYNAAYNSLWFAVPEGASTTNNMLLVYDLSHRSWWVHRGIPVSCMVEYNDGSTIKLYAGHSSLGWTMKQNTGFNDIGSAITAYWVGKNFDGDLAGRKKLVKDVFVVDVKSLNDATFNYKINRAAAWTAPTATSDADDRRKFKIDYGTFYYFQPKFLHSTLDADFCLSEFNAYWRWKSVS